MIGETTMTEHLLRMTRATGMAGITRMTRMTRIAGITRMT